MATVLKNGVSYGWSNITVIGLGVPFIGITKVSYKSKQEKTNNYGAGSEPVSRGYGRVEYEASIELYTEDWKRIIAASPERNPLLIPAFDMSLLLAGQGLTTETEVLRACEFLENPLDASEGDTKLMITIPLIIAGIER